MKLAVDESSLGQTHVTRTRDAYGSSESTEVALDEMKRQLGSWALNALFTHDQQQIALGEDPQSCQIHPGYVDDDFNRFVPFVDVDGGGAFAGKRLGISAAAELVEDPPNVLRKVGGFGSD